MTKRTEVHPLYQRRSKSARTFPGEAGKMYDELAKLRMDRLKPALQARALRKAPPKKP